MPPGKGFATKRGRQQPDQVALTASAAKKRRETRAGVDAESDNQSEDEHPQVLRRSRRSGQASSEDEGSVLSANATDEEKSDEVAGRKPPAKKARRNSTGADAGLPPTAPGPAAQPAGVAVPQTEPRRGKPKEAIGIPPPHPGPKRATAPDGGGSAGGSAGGSVGGSSSLQEVSARRTRSSSAEREPRRTRSSSADREPVAAVGGAQNGVHPQARPSPRGASPARIRQLTQPVPGTASASPAPPDEGGPARQPLFQPPRSPSPPRPSTPPPAAQKPAPPATPSSSSPFARAMQLASARKGEGHAGRGGQQPSTLTRLLQALALLSIAVLASVAVWGLQRVFHDWMWPPGKAPPYKDDSLPRAKQFWSQSPELPDLLEQVGQDERSLAKLLDQEGCVEERLKKLRREAHDRGEQLVLFTSQVEQLRKNRATGHSMGVEEAEPMLEELERNMTALSEVYPLLEEGVTTFSDWVQHAVAKPEGPELDRQLEQDVNRLREQAEGLKGELKDVPSKAVALDMDGMLSSEQKQLWADEFTQLQAQAEDALARKLREERIRQGRQMVDSVVEERASAREAFFAGDTAQNIGQVSLPQAREVVRDELDGITDGWAGMPDFAAISAGARVLHGERLTSPDLATHLSTLGQVAHTLRFVDRIHHEPAESVISKSTELGKCWRFHGSEGFFTVALAEPLEVSYFTLQQAAAVLDPRNGASYPKDVRLYGYESNPVDTKAEALDIGTASYNLSGNATQTFRVADTAAGRGVIAVTLHILSNHGDESTCLYNFLVHGRLYGPMREATP